MVDVLDAQVHIVLTDRPSRPWSSHYRRETTSARLLINAGKTFTAEDVLVEMAEAGVDASVLTPVGVYGNDNSLELEAAVRFPRKFCVIGWIDQMLPRDVLDEVMRSEISRGIKGYRFVRARERERLERGEFATAFQVMEELGLPVSITISHPIDARLTQLFEKHAALTFLIDHLGVGFAPPVHHVDGDAEERIEAVAELARFPNVVVKATGLAALSRSGRFPFDDTWPLLFRLLDTFGVDRVVWGTDFTRTAGLHSYWDAVNYLKEVPGLTRSELSRLYGQNLRRVLKWQDPFLSDDRQ